jgi:hypothetical protein
VESYRGGGSRLWRIFGRWLNRADLGELGTNLVLRLMLPVCALVVVIFGVRDLPDALAAARGEGVPGTFVALAEDCSGRGECSWSGRFVPDDGSPALDNVLLNDDVPGGAGQLVHVLYEGATGPAIVYQAQGDQTWVWIAVLLTGAVGYLGYCAWWLLSRVSPFRRGPRKP